MTTDIVRSDASTPLIKHKDGNGFARLEGVIARVGVYTYTKADGSIQREFVSPSTLIDCDGVDGIPITIGHPRELVSPESFQRLSHGAASKPRIDGDKLKTALTVSSSKAQSVVEAGTHQLSPGYRVELDFTPGVYNGEHYDAIQKKRIYNHLALVDMARGGEECRLNLDGIDCAVGVTTTKTEAKMADVKLPNGATVEVGNDASAVAIQDAFNADAASKADMQAEMKTAKAKVDELQGKIDAMEEAEKDRDDSADMLSHLETLDQCRKLKGDLEIKADGKLKSEKTMIAEALNYDGEASVDYLRGMLAVKLDQASADAMKGKRGDGIKSDSKPAISAQAQANAAFYAQEAK